MEALIKSPVRAELAALVIHIFRYVCRDGVDRVIVALNVGAPCGRICRKISRQIGRFLRNCFACRHEPALYTRQLEPLLRCYLGTAVYRFND